MSAISACHTGSAAIPGLLLGLPGWAKWALILLVYGAVITESQVTFQDKSDYCQLESFNVSCGDGEIIVLLSAVYGRMRPGRCITRSYGNLGCSANVLPYMDTRCSGKKACVVPIPDPMLHRTLPCPKDFTTYLEVEYQCIKVTHSNSPDCPGDSGLQRLEAGEGYLAAAVPKSSSAATGAALETGCPWRITAQPGQSINISLVNFNSSRSTPYASYGHGVMSSRGGDGGGHHRGPCVDVATVVDGDNQEALQLCRHQQREVTAYVSKAHDITLHLPHSAAPGQEAGMFLLRYKAVGCPDVRPQAGLWVRRTGDTAMVRCNLTEETWYLSCEGNDWKGRVGNCSQAPKKWNMDGTVITEEPVPYGILITVAIGAALGIFLGGVLLAIVLLIRRYRMTPREAHEPDYQIRDSLPRKSFDMDKGYAPVLDERGHFPVSAERFPLPVSIPTCPETAGSTTQLPVDVTAGATLPRDAVRIEAPIFCSHPECHVYETTRLGLVANQNKRTS